ncbi:hypothetical protein DLM78_20385 [Leptospira stimsonii]|uniref:Uncharacterized protein n=1 Tax=Leptospira stimsonii TaxID=2202203 RepID=A0A8B3CNC1_9LEPT|nr:hypothetical protein DLM78_20385 [Leptospira stimsonii]
MKAEIDIETLKVLSENSSNQKKEKGKLLYHPSALKNGSLPGKNPEKRLRKDYISMIQSLLF